MGLFSKHKTDTPPMPPMPSLGSNKNSGMDLPPMPQTSDLGNLTPPPIPGANLDDIKMQVSSNTNKFSRDNLASMGDNDSSSDDFSTDSLFDVFPDTIEQETKEEVPAEQDLESDFSMEDSTVDTNMSRSDSLSFARNKSYSNPSKDSCFLTTQQFKSLLELVENVKSKVKDSTDVHLRLMDMKSEEDIEYENLRKSFQYIEDKLYELDNILFEN